MMRMLALATLCAAGCNLVDSNGLHIGYSFDAQHFTENVGGDPKNPGTVPSVPCQSGASPDMCAQAAAMLPPSMLGSTQVSCVSSACQASAEVTLPQKIDLRNAQSPVPPQAAQFGISAVAIDRIAYWITNPNTLDIDTPNIDLYVAPDTAKDITDPNAVLLGTVHSIPAGSSACSDPMDAQGDAAAMGQKVCDVPLTQPGQAALSKFVQNYMNAPFEILVHATLTAKGGQPFPAGVLDFYVRPSVTLSILK